ncbi:MAG: hypothetical protein Q8R08_00685 [bacterium]|nr:hypothetical protein [bacterium]
MNSEKLQRFGRPEFQEKLARARRFTRKSEPLSPSLASRLFQGLGLKSGFARLALLGVFALAVYFLTISDLFLVRQATLRSDGLGAEQINRVLGEIGKQRLYLVPKNHILLLTKSRVFAAMQREFPEIKRIEYYRRVFPNRIEIGLVERNGEYVLASREGYFLLDQDAVAFERIINYEPAAIPAPLIIDDSGTEVSLGENLEIQNVLNFLDKLRGEWPRDIHGIDIENFTLPGLAATDVKVRTSRGFIVYFDTSRDPKTQLRNLAYLLNSEIKPETHSGLSYIDLRLGSTGYFCFKDAPCALENATSTKP